ncbi:MAG TPA: hypothetical protein VMV40_04645 [Acidiferrobacter sp.]|nr:hypothetical protein [Acidiferrobacter sp.]
MDFFEQPPLQHLTGPHPRYAIIWLHGLGADGHDFEGFVDTLAGITDQNIHFVFPHAPVQAVTLNNGMPSPSWFDLYGMQPYDPQDEAGIQRASRAISGLIAEEQTLGIPSERVVLGGFSQGGALALSVTLTGPYRLLAGVGLSTYLPLAHRFVTDLPPDRRALPVFLGHGTEDLVVPYSYAVKTQHLLAKSGVNAVLHTYPIGHSVSDDEIMDLRTFLANALATAALGADATSL